MSKWTEVFVVIAVSGLLALTVIFMCRCGEDRKYPEPCPPGPVCHHCSGGCRCLRTDVCTCSCCHCPHCKPDDCCPNGKCPIRPKE